jgi:hypothetical protein
MNRAESAGKRSSPTAIRNGRLKSTPAVCVQAAAINRSFFVLATELSLPDVRRSKRAICGKIRGCGRRARLRPALSEPQARPQRRRAHVCDCGEAPGRALGAVGLRHHEEAANRRGSCARPWPWGPMMLRWLRRRQDAPWAGAGRRGGAQGARAGAPVIFLTHLRPNCARSLQFAAGVRARGFKIAAEAAYVLTVGKSRTSRCDCHSSILTEMKSQQLRQT